MAKGNIPHCAARRSSVWKNSVKREVGAELRATTPTQTRISPYLIAQPPPKTLLPSLDLGTPSSTKFKTPRPTQRPAGSSTTSSRSRVASTTPQQRTPVAIKPESPTPRQSAVQASSGSDPPSQNGKTSTMNDLSRTKHDTRGLSSQRPKSSTTGGTPKLEQPKLPLSTKAEHGVRSSIPRVVPRTICNNSTATSLIREWVEASTARASAAGAVYHQAETGTAFDSGMAEVPHTPVRGLSGNHSRQRSARRSKKRTKQRTKSVRSNKTPAATAAVPQRYHSNHSAEASSSNSLTRVLKQSKSTADKEKADKKPKNEHVPTTHRKERREGEDHADGRSRRSPRRSDGSFGAGSDAQDVFIQPVVQLPSDRKHKKKRKGRKRRRIARAISRHCQENRTGIHAELIPTRRLQRFLANPLVGGKQWEITEEKPVVWITRQEAIKKVWEYIRKAGLQDPSDGRLVRCEGLLHGMFGQLKLIHMLQVPSFLNQHLHKPDDVLRERVQSYSDDTYSSYSSRSGDENDRIPQKNAVHPKSNENDEAASFSFASNDSAAGNDDPLGLFIPDADTSSRGICAQELSTLTSTHTPALNSISSSPPVPSTADAPPSQISIFPAQSLASLNTEFSDGVANLDDEDGQASGNHKLKITSGNQCNKRRAPTAANPICPFENTSGNYPSPSAKKVRQEDKRFTSAHLPSSTAINSPSRDCSTSAGPAAGFLYNSALIVDPSQLQSASFSANTAPHFLTSSEAAMTMTQPFGPPVEPPASPNASSRRHCSSVPGTIATPAGRSRRNPPLCTPSTMEMPKNAKSYPPLMGPDPHIKYEHTKQQESPGILDFARSPEAAQGASGISISEIPSPGTEGLDSCTPERSLFGGLPVTKQHSKRLATRLPSTSVSISPPPKKEVKLQRERDDVRSKSSQIPTAGKSRLNSPIRSIDIVHIYDSDDSRDAANKDTQQIKDERPSGGRAHDPVQPLMTLNQSPTVFRNDGTSLGDASAPSTAALRLILPPHPRWPTPSRHSAQPDGLPKAEWTVHTTARGAQDAGCGGMTRGVQISRKQMGLDKGIETETDRSFISGVAPVRSGI